MPESSRHQQLTETLRAVPRLGLPVAGLSIMYSVEREVVEAGYLWIGEKRPSASRTISRAGGDINIDVDESGNFIGVELLRRVTVAEARSFYRWAHRHWDAPKSKPHWPCSALMTLLDAWEDAERLVCPSCRAMRSQQARERVGYEIDWKPELVRV